MPGSRWLCRSCAPPDALRSAHGDAGGVRAPGRVRAAQEAGEAAAPAAAPAAVGPPAGPRRP